MFKISSLLLGVCAAGMSVAAQAQGGSSPGDRDYCEKLVVIYVRYIGHDNDNAQNFLLRGANDAQVASTQCQTNTALAIPILERQLVDNKFTLPARN
jgi:hypothetical protein